MRAVGMSANMMSLGGLAIAIGMLVDCTVVVVENIVAQSQQGRATGVPTPLHPWRVRSVCEVAAARRLGRAHHHHRVRAAAHAAGARGQAVHAGGADDHVCAGRPRCLLSLTVVPVATSFLLKAAPHREPWLMRLASRALCDAC